MELWCPVLVWTLDEIVTRGAFPETEVLAILMIALLPGNVREEVEIVLSDTTKGSKIL